MTDTIIRVVTEKYDRYSNHKFCLKIWKIQQSEFLLKDMIRRAIRGLAWRFDI